MSVKNIQVRARKIKVLALDVDGVLTDGKIVLDHQGNEIKIFDVQDGLGIVFLRKLGFKTAIISARASSAVTARAKDLGFDKVYQDAYPKSVALKKMLTEFKVPSEHVCFMGDDLPDICVLKEVGLAVSVPNGRPEAQQAAHYITKKHGGKGAVREVVELILKSQRKWDALLKAI